MKILITGGHLTPALAVIERLKDHQVFYVGRKYTFEGEKAVSLEYRQIEKLGIPFFEIKTARLQRKITRFTLTSLLKMPGGFLESYKILKKTNPDIILTFGSYVSVPIGLMAKLLNKPLVIHEQTLEVGFANKILSKFADKICISWDSSLKFFPKNKTIITGNPVRQEIFKFKNIKPKGDLIYISGGSSGSHAINLLVEENLDKLLNHFSIIHQTGDSQKYKDYERLLNKKNNIDKRLSSKYKLVKFLTTSEAAETIAKSSLLVGRSGINTVTELIILNKPAFLIPLAISQRSEQLKNAEFLNRIGNAEYKLQDEITPSTFYKEILSLYKNKDNYKIKNRYNLENASEKIIKVLEDVYKKKNS